ncbi:DUF3426 domain-containing protein [Massilia endophytica]|nr:DUF3426 domain-containing protein [Massilia endophytica]
MRGGIVRCGACNEVFDGNAALVEPLAKPSPVMPAVPVASPHPETVEETAAALAPAAFLDEPELAEESPALPPEPEPELMEALAADIDTEEAPAETTEEGEVAEAGVQPLSEPDAEEAHAEDGEPEEPPAAETLDFIVDPDAFADPLPAPSAAGGEADTPQEHIVAAALDDAHHFDDLPAREAAPDSEPAEEPIASEAEDAGAAPPAPPEGTADDDAEAKRSADQSAAAELPALESASLAAGAVAMAPEPEAEADGDEPGFVKRANRRQRLQRVGKVVMAFGTPILLAGLLAQGVATFRNPLAASFPQLKPTLNSLCQPLGCKVELPMQIDMLAIEQGELQTLADNTYSYVTVLRNQARNPQAWPSIELVLNDSADKPVLRRVFAPRDYLPSQAELDKGFAPRSEQPVKLYFELSQVKASGYHIAIFYP